MRPARWRRSTHVVIGVAVLLLAAAVVAVAAVVTSGGRSTSEAKAVKPQPTPALAHPGVTPLADSAPKPAPDKLTATLAPFVADPNLGAFTGRVTDAMTGAQLWAQGAGIPMQPASSITDSIGAMSPFSMSSGSQPGAMVGPLKALASTLMAVTASPSRFT
jgi:D-alanyl-D-alanine carboxypeptidase/D-alanyl-D-alanine-endopeptidase (penicillin-binding protein 4)